MENYTIKQERMIPQIGKGTLLMHNQTGAEICYIQNKDDNKVFFIGFKTPPPDMTGVPHILEHSVLCGSKKYPVKDPFNELAKSSFHTYLNAMTYNDKTVYPIASYHHQDFHNLMDVYLDSVFHPLIKENKNIFYQEGWHYHLQDKKDQLTINGVVYNEMKGVYSGPERILTDCITKGIFKNGFYLNSSGGIPDFIPSLTYEQFIQYYDQYYHPSNSFIYVYGDGDMACDLALIHSYLQEYTCKAGIPWDCFELNKGIREVTANYSITRNETPEDKTFLSYSVPVGKLWDTKLMFSMEILANALFNFPGAPIKEIILKEKVAKDVQASLHDARIQPVFNIVAKNSNPKLKKHFLALLESEFLNICNNGLDKDFLEGALYRHRFYYEDENYGYRPKGLVYGLMLLRSWIYGKDPFQSLFIPDILKELQEEVQTGYFEKILQRYIWQNETIAHGVLKPKQGLQEEINKKDNQKLQAYKETLAEKELNDILQKTQQLLLYQNQPEESGLLEKIPYVHLEDIPRKGRELLYNLDYYQDIPMITTSAEGEVAYINLHFKLDKVPYSSLPYAGLLSKILGKMPTEHFDVPALAKQINLYTGGIQVYSQTIVRKGVLIPVLTIKGKCLVQQIEKLFDLFQEIIQTVVTDLENLEMEYKKQLANIQGKWISQGHTMGISRAISNVDASGIFQQAFSGLDYYDALLEMDGHMGAVAQKLCQVSAKIFTKENMLFQATASPKWHSAIVKHYEHWLQCISDEKNGIEALPNPAYKNEGLILSSKVQYNIFASKSWCWEDYNGQFALTKTIINRDYLWNTIRVKGGAYGSNIQFTRNGLMYMYSYRDPHIKETLQYFYDLHAYVKQFSCSDQAFQKYIAGTINQLDKPLHPQDKGDIVFMHYIMDIHPHDIQKEREEILGASLSDIRSLASYLEKGLADGCYCTIGNEEEIRKYGRYHSVRNIF